MTKHNHRELWRKMAEIHAILTKMREFDTILGRKELR